MDRSDAKPHDHADAKIYEYPGQYMEMASGQDSVVVRFEEATVSYDLSTGATDSRGLSTGVLFSLVDHPRDDQNREYMVVSTQYDIDSGSYRSGATSAVQMHTHVMVLDSKTQYRPTRTIPVPTVAGP